MDSDRVSTVPGRIHWTIAAVWFAIHEPHYSSDRRSMFNGLLHLVVQQGVEKPDIAVGVAIVLEFANDLTFRQTGAGQQSDSEIMKTTHASVREKILEVACFLMGQPYRSVTNPETYRVIITRYLETHWSKNFSAQVECTTYH